MGPTLRWPIPDLVAILFSFLICTSIFFNKTIDRKYQGMKSSIKKQNKITAKAITLKQITHYDIETALYLAIAYLGVLQLCNALRPEHFVLVGLCATAYFVGEKSRKVLRAYSVILGVWVLQDLLKVFPNYTVNPANIDGAYLMEQSLFGISWLGSSINPGEYLAHHAKAFFDFLSGFTFLAWIPMLLGVSIYFYQKNRDTFFRFSLAILLVTIVSYLIFYIYPTAPPWYIGQYGTELHYDVPSNGAGLIRFDNLVGIPVFEQIYKQNVTMLAAFPSLFVAYPALVLFYGSKSKLGTINILFFLFMLVAWFSAVYSGQHFLIDTIAGILLAMGIAWLFERWSAKGWVKKQIGRFVATI